jgi:hypothetical protein
MRPQGAMPATYQVVLTALVLSSLARRCNGGKKDKVRKREKTLFHDVELK